MNRRKPLRSPMWLVCLAGLGLLLALVWMMDDDHGRKGFFEREDQHPIPYLESDNEGNETAGQIAAWLLVAANLPVALSILIKWTIRKALLGAQIKAMLTDLNRWQKKTFMWLHYYLNLTILVVALWHWLASRCTSSALPELGFLVMVVLIATGFLIKFRLCPRALRKTMFQVHTQPLVFAGLLCMLTVGHLIVD